MTGVRLPDSATETLGPLGKTGSSLSEFLEIIVSLLYVVQLTVVVGSVLLLTGWLMRYVLSNQSSGTLREQFFKTSVSVGVVYTLSAILRMLAYAVSGNTSFSTFSTVLVEPPNDAFIGFAAAATGAPLGDTAADPKPALEVLSNLLLATQISFFALGATTLLGAFLFQVGRGKQRGIPPQVVRILMAFLPLYALAGVLRAISLIFLQTTNYTRVTSFILIPIQTTFPVPIASESGNLAPTLDILSTALLTVQATIVAGGILALFLVAGLAVLKLGPSEYREKVLRTAPLVLVLGYVITVPLQLVAFVVRSQTSLDSLESISVGLLGGASVTLPQLPTSSVFGVGGQFGISLVETIQILTFGFFYIIRLTTWIAGALGIIGGVIAFLSKDSATSRRYIRNGAGLMLLSLTVAAVFSAIDWVIPISPEGIVASEILFLVSTPELLGSGDPGIQAFEAFLRATDILLVTLLIGGFIALSSALVRLATEGRQGGYSLAKVSALLIVLYLPLTILRVFVFVVPGVDALSGSYVPLGYRGESIALTVPFVTGGPILPSLRPVLGFFSNILSIVQATLFIAAALLTLYALLIGVLSRDAGTVRARVRSSSVTLIALYAYTAVFKTLGYVVPAASLTGTNKSIAILSSVAFPTRYLPGAPSLGVYTGEGSRQGIVSVLRNLLLIDQLTLFVLAVVFIFYGVGKFVLGKGGTGTGPNKAVQAGKLAIVIFLLSPTFEAITWLMTGTTVGDSSIAVTVAGDTISTVELPFIALAELPAETILGFGASYNKAVQGLARAVGIGISSVATIAFVGVAIGLVLKCNPVTSGLINDEKISAYGEHLVWGMGLVLVIAFILPPIASGFGWLATGESVSPGQTLSGSVDTVEDFEGEHSWTAQAGSIETIEAEGTTKLLIDGKAEATYTPPDVRVDNPSEVEKQLVITTDGKATLLIQSNGVTHVSTNVDAGTHSFPVPNDEVTIRVKAYGTAIDNIGFTTTLN
jgi:hypothetical protein